jgi:hypothetical protein
VVELPRYRNQTLPSVSVISPYQAGAGALSDALARGADVVSRVTAQIAQAEAVSSAQAAVSDLRIKTQEFLSRNEWENTEIGGRPTDEVIDEQWREFQASLESPDIRDRRAAEQYRIARNEILSDAGIRVDNLKRKILVDRTRANDLKASENLLSLGNYTASRQVISNSLGFGEQEKLSIIQRNAAIATDRFVMEDPYKALEELQKGESEQPFINDLDPADRNTRIRQAEAEIARREAALRAEQAARRAEAEASFSILKDQVMGFTEALKLGIAVPPSSYSQVVGAISALPDSPKKALLMEDLIAVNNILASGFPSLPPDQQKAAVAQFTGKLQEGGYNRVDVTALSIMKSMAENSAAAANADPAALAISKGWITPVSRREGETEVQWLTRVYEAGKTASSALGRPVPGLTNEQISALTRQYSAADLDGRVGMIGQIVRTHGRDAAVTLLEQVKKNAGNDLAIAGFLALDGPEGIMASRMVVKGQTIRQEAALAGKPYKALEIDLVPEINSRLRNAYWDRPEDRNLIEGAIRDAYLALAVEAGKLGAEGLDRNLVTKAVNLVTGGIVSFNGLFTPAPKRGVTEDQFRAFATSLDEKDFANVAGLTPEYALDAYRRDGRLRQIAQGVFVIQVPAGPGGTYIDLKATRGQYKDRNGVPLLTVDYRDPDFLKGTSTSAVPWAFPSRLPFSE